MSANFLSIFNTVLATVAVRHILDVILKCCSKREDETQNSFHNIIAGMFILLLSSVVLAIAGQIYQERTRATVIRMDLTIKQAPAVEIETIEAELFEE